MLQIKVKCNSYILGEHSEDRSRHQLVEKNCHHSSKTAISTDKDGTTTIKIL